MSLLCRVQDLFQMDIVIILKKKAALSVKSPTHSYLSTLDNNPEYCNLNFTSFQLADSIL